MFLGKLFPRGPVYGNIPVVKVDPSFRKELFQCKTAISVRSRIDRDIRVLHQLIITSVLTMLLYDVRVYLMIIRKCTLLFILAAHEFTSLGFFSWNSGLVFP